MARLWVFTPPTSSTTALTNFIYPNADGAVVSIPWSGDTAPARGGWEKSAAGNHASAGYSYTNFDAVINQQLGFGAKNVVIVLAPISFGGSNNSTPNYVFDATYAANNGYTQLFTCADSDYLGSGAITSGSCAQGVDNTAFPITIMPAFQVAWRAAVADAISHMSGAGYANKIAYIRVGGGAGGEWFPFATSALIVQLYGPVNPTNIGKLKTDWTGYMSNVESTIVGVGSSFKFVQAMDGGLNGGNVNGATAIPYNWCDAEAAIANSNGFGMGTEGLTGNWTGATGSNSDVQRFANHGYSSGGTNTFTYPSMDSAFVFHTYGTASSVAPILQAQTGGGGASDPTGASSPGSLSTILPYATNQLYATDIELYYQDWQVAYDSSNTHYATYHVQYQALIQAARSITQWSVPDPPVIHRPRKQIIHPTTSFVFAPAGATGLNVRDSQDILLAIQKLTSNIRDSQDILLVPQSLTSHIRDSQDVILAIYKSSVANQLLSMFQTNQPIVLKKRYVIFNEISETPIIIAVSRNKFVVSFVVT